MWKWKSVNLWNRKLEINYFNKRSIILASSQFRPKTNLWTLRSKKAFRKSYFIVSFIPDLCTVLFEQMLRDTSASRPRWVLVARGHAKPWICWRCWSWIHFVTLISCKPSLTSVSYDLRVTMVISFYVYW